MFAQNLQTKYLRTHLVPVKNNTIQPYPDETSQKNITSSIYIKKDKFDRLWVLDCGAIDILGDKIQINPPKLFTYSLTTNQLIRTFTFPENQYTNDSLFVYLAVEAVTEQDTFVYIADIANNLLVYDWKQNTSKVVRVVCNFLLLFKLQSF